MRKFRHKVRSRTAAREEVPTDVKCPRCGRWHVLVMKWVGTGTPRFYCHECKNYVEGIYLPEAGRVFEKENP